MSTVIGEIPAGYDVFRLDGITARELVQRARHQVGYRPATHGEVVAALEAHPVLEVHGEIGAVRADGTVVAMGHHCDKMMCRSPGIEGRVIHPDDTVSGVVILLIAER
jgi:hypothetical protein